ncbi:adhesive plaque matrix protein-like [Penaeus japonicus]|uniref:adhesive plaque matrix protein-like n=1 Tax=Penaeus japonicus TaxID=27405 RepID=UPI001C70EFA4|nr:adhesive plaque matrix protein-like [Penaeus japonicus]
MVRVAVLFWVTVVVLTETVSGDDIRPHDATETELDIDNSSADTHHYSEDEYDDFASESQPLLPDDQGYEEVLLTAGSEVRPQRRRRPGGKRRRLPLDPERLRLIIKRRQELGLPVRKLVRAQQALIAYEEQIRAQMEESPAVDASPEIPTNGHTFVTTTPSTPAPRTRLPTTTTITTTTTTSAPVAATAAGARRRTRFPSFSAAKRHHQRPKEIRDSWGLKTSVLEKDEEQKEEPENGEGEGKTFRSTTPTSRSLSARRRGLAKVLKRPVYPKVLVNSSPTPTPTLKPSPVTVASEDKRLRYRPVLARKKKLQKQHTATSPSSSVTAGSPIYGPYEPGSYDDHSQSTRLDDLPPKPKHTPVPKKVVLDPVPTTDDKHFQDLQEPSYFPEEPTYSILRPDFTPQNTAYTTAAPVYTTGASAYTPHDPLDIVYDPAEHASPVYAPAPNFASEPVSIAHRAKPQQSYVHEPAYAVESKYSSEPVYVPEPSYEPAYPPEPVYAPEPVYEPSYDSEQEYNHHLDYSSEEDDARAGIFDQYKYGYSVASEDTGNYHARSEARDGETVSGSYKVALPDGRVQVVTYIADDQGFRAEVTYEGEAIPPNTTPDPAFTHAPSRTSVHAAAFPSGQSDPDYFPTHQADPKPLVPTASSSLPASPIRPIRPVPRPVRHQFSDRGQVVNHAPAHTPPASDHAHAATLPSHPAHPPTPPPHHVRTPTPPPHHPRTHTPLPVHNTTPSPPSQNLHFGDHFHVTTASPNPFRLVVDKSRASTFSPLPPAPVFPPSPPSRPSSSSSSSSFSSFRNSQRHQTTTTTPKPQSPSSRPAYTASFKPALEAPFTSTARPVTNAHVADNGFRTKSPSQHTPSFHHQTTSTTPKSTTNAHTITPAHSHGHVPSTTTVAPPPADLYEYKPTGHAGGVHTMLYNPDPESRAYIHALGQAHAVPLLLPFSPSHHVHDTAHDSGHGDEASTHPHHNVLPPPPRTYYLSQPTYSIPAYASTAAPQIVRLFTPAPAHSAESVEITRGDGHRPRISIKVPEPHEADIYPAPRPRLRLR